MKGEGNTVNTNFQHSDLTDKIIGCFYDVYNTLGCGFLEKVYENALKVELEIQGHSVESQKPIKVTYKGTVVGDYFADMIVDHLVIIEVKTCEILSPSHQYQLQNYLKATDIEVGLLLNFGHKPQFVRRVFTNSPR